MCAFVLLADRLAGEIRAAESVRHPLTSAPSSYPWLQAAAACVTTMTNSLSVYNPIVVQQSPPTTTQQQQQSTPTNPAPPHSSYYNFNGIHLAGNSGCPAGGVNRPRARRGIIRRQSLLFSIELMMNNCTDQV